MDEAAARSGFDAATPDAPAGPVDVCPLLRAADGRGGLGDPVRAIDPRNRCAAGALAALVGPIVQGETCLVPEHAACPRFLAATRLAAAAAAAPTAPASPASPAAAAQELRRDPRRRRSARALTPAIMAAGVFALVCAVISVGFVAARGGLVLDLGSPSPVAVASAEPSPAATPEPTPEPTAAPTPSPEPTAAPTAAPTPEPTAEPTPTGPADLLLGLPGCPDHPGCYLYVVQRGDSLFLVADTYGVPVYLIREFNPQVVADGDRLRLGETLRLGRSRYVVLDRCADTAGCWLYVVKSGDTLSGIAQRYAVPLDQLIADNPVVKDGLYAGQTLRLIPPTPPF